MADMTSPTGNPSATNPMQTSFAIGWQSGTTPNKGARLSAAQVTIPGYSKHLLIGATALDQVLHIAEINASNGNVSEVATAPTQSIPTQVEVSVVNNRIFVFTAEGGQGLNVYEFVPPSTLAHVATIAMDARRLAVRGPQPFPILFVHKYQGSSSSWINIYDTKWLTQGGSPLLAKSLPHFGGGASFQGAGFEAFVQNAGATLTALRLSRAPADHRRAVHPDRQGRRLLPCGRPRRSAGRRRHDDEPLGAHASEPGEHEELLRRQVAAEGRLGLLPADHQHGVGHRDRAERAVCGRCGVERQPEYEPGALRHQPRLLAVRSGRWRQPLGWHGLLGERGRAPGR